MPRPRTGGRPSRLRNLIYRAIDRLGPDETTTMVLVAAVVGVIGGFGAIFFRWLVQLFQGLAIGHGENVVELLEHVTWWRKLLLPVAGGLIVGPLVWFGAREAKGHGVPEVIAAVVFKDGVIRPVVAAVKILASAVTIAFGGSVGREGPIIQIGAAMGSSLGQWLRFSPQRLRTLIGCGAAAGIAATFNAPIAGAIFALEIILRDFAIVTFSPIIVASVVATAVSRHFLGDVPAFPVPEFALGAWTELPLYAVMGAIVGIGSIIYIRSLYWCEDAFDRLRFPPWGKPLLGAVPLGVLIVFFPQVYGIGYDSMVSALNGEMLWPLMLGLVAVKLVAVNLTLGAGFSGGIFAPALFLGGMLGGACGGLIDGFGMPVDVGGFVMVGMAAMVAAATRGPITAILILFEMTGEYAIILPLMLACILAVLVSQKMLSDSIFTLKFSRSGRHLNYGRESAILKAYHVQDAMETNTPVIVETDSLDQVLELFLENSESRYFVTDRDGGLAGAISIHDVKDLLGEKGLGAAVLAADLCKPEPRRIYRQDDLEEALMLFVREDLLELPVLDRPGDPKLVGVLQRKSLFDIYNQEVLNKEVLGLKILHRDTGMRDFLELPAPYKVRLLSPPAHFLGKSLRDLELRQSYNVTVLAFKRKGFSTRAYNELPDPERRITKVDRLIVAGRAEDLDRLCEVVRGEDDPPGETRGPTA